MVVLVIVQSYGGRCCQSQTHNSDYTTQCHMTASIMTSDKILQM